MGLDEHLGELDERHAHPRAKELLAEASACLWSADVGPLNSDRGHDAFAQFPEWRAGHPRQGLDKCLRWVLESWDLKKYGREILDTDTIQKQLADEALDFHQDVFVLDETIIATALAQLIYEGGIDAAAKPTVRLAVERQMHPLVMARLFEGEAAEERARALREVLRLLDVTEDVTKEARQLHVARLRQAEDDAANAREATKALNPCPWPVGSILRRRLPSGTPLLLHLYAMQPYGWAEKQELLPAFYVLSQNGEELPSPDELERIGPSDEWTFSLELPPAPSPEGLEARNAAIEAMLEPTGLTKQAQSRSAVSRVPWARLDEYLIYNYDPKAKT